MRILRNQNGQGVLAFSLILAVILTGIFVYVSSQSSSLVDRVRRTQGLAYGNQLSVKFAQRLRWSYDAAKADAANASLGLCASYTGTLVTVGGAPGIPLCIVSNQICVQHPFLPSQQVCISPVGASPTIIGQHRSLLDSVIPRAEAQSMFIPADPPAGATSNALSVATNTCLNNTVDCLARCGTAGVGGNADCLTIKFCPLVGTCNTDGSEDVWQTIALIR